VVYTTRVFAKPRELQAGDFYPARENNRFRANASDITQVINQFAFLTVASDL